jgi:hypothetical protein
MRRPTTAPPEWSDYGASGGWHAQCRSIGITKLLRGDLAAAQADLTRAWNKILDAQNANEFDLGGHAQKAKDLIDQANKELKQTAEAAGK